MATQLSVLDNFKQSITKMEDEFKAVLPVTIDPKKFVRVVVTAVQKEPTLLSQKRQSLFNACMLCATDGLIPDGREAALVKFKGEVAYMPMVTGIMKKVRNSGELGMIDAQVVYEKDEYKSWTDENGPHFKHVRARKDRGKPMLTFAYARTKDGFLYFEELDEDQISKIANMSKTATVWNGAFRDEMRRKSAIRRLSKRLPMSTDVEQVIQRDDDLYDLDKQADIVGDKDEDVEVKSSLEKAVESHTEEEVVEAEFKEDPPVEDEVKAEVKAREGKWYVEGTIDSMKVKTGPLNKETGNPKWIKHGFKIKNKMYTTFSTTLATEAGKMADDKALVKVVYEEAVKDGKKHYNALSFEVIEAEEEGNIPI